MKAVVYDGPRQVSVKDVPDARIERPTDVLVRITSANICGSDLHMYEGRTDFEPGRWFGHENLGQVVEVGDGVDKVQVGEYVVLPFNIACGHCKNCERQLTNYCLTAQPEPSMAGAAYGFADMGPYGGGQAELLRVPWGDFNCLRLGEDAEQRQTDYVMLADIFPTGYHATEMAGVQPGDQTVIYGAGPVGLMAALSATIRGASKVMVVDRQPDRLRLAESIGAIAIDDSKVDPVQAVLDADHGARRGQRLRVRRLPGARARRAGATEPDAEPAGRLGAVHRQDRRRRGVRPAGPRRAGRAGQAGQGRLRLRHVLVQGPADGQRPGAGQEVQPAAARPDRRRQGRAVVHREPRAAPRPGAGGLRALRQAGRRLDEGRPAPGDGGAGA